ncbi:MAG TPA: hypothetical protein PLR44_00040 [Thermomicrobiales bacterium]|nr:hypothetical protein [Chloroflexota bacterium]HCG28600.1 hypothetical protein [Chloroflexota bacterium]HQZ88433.1 hypothetical protein [Thermomicrobiales bacterium]HRA30436.1 hypothetical protein [Thermomicrobiales bacterium]
MRSASTANRPARSVAVLFATLLLLSGCAAPRVIRETPTTIAPETPTPVAIASPTLASPTVSPTTDARSYTVDRVALATRVDANGAPIVETTVVSETARQIFLCVHVLGIWPGAPFRAYWIENDQVIGQSDALAIETQGRPTWVALEYRPPFALKPDADYAVELLIDNQKINRFVFRAGKGDPAKAVAEAAFATGFNTSGKPTGVRTSFPADATELIFRARVSNMVDPTGWIFTTLWYRDDVLVAQLGPDETDNGRLLSFTLRPGGDFPPGPYAVALLLNGIEARIVPFEITSASNVPADDTAGTPSTPASSNARVTRAVLTDRVDSQSNAPEGDEITVWNAVGRTTADLWLAVAVTRLTREDIVEIRVNQTGTLYANQRLPRQAVASGWVSAPISLSVPSVPDGPVEYTLTVLLNGNRTQTVTVLVVPVTR